MSGPSTSSELTDYLGHNLALKNAFAASYSVQSVKVGSEGDTELSHTSIEDHIPDPDDIVPSVEIHQIPDTNLHGIPAIMSLRSYDPTNQKQPYPAYKESTLHSDAVLILRQLKPLIGENENNVNVVQQTFFPAGSDHILSYPQDDKSTIIICGKADEYTSIHNDQGQESILHFWRDTTARSTDLTFAKILSHATAKHIRSQAGFDIFGYTRYIPYLPLSDDEDETNQGKEPGDEATDGEGAMKREEVEETLSVGATPRGKKRPAFFYKTKAKAE